MKNIQNLKDLIKLKKIDDLTYVGRSESIGSAIVFGGQVLAQGVYAMAQSVPEERQIHSLHSYFILPGDLEKEIIFKVEKIRDGGSFSTRSVKALQDGNVIFFMSGSFHRKEEGYQHQIKMPEVPNPEVLPSWEDIYEKVKEKLPKALKYFLSVERPFIFKSTQIENILIKQAKEPKQSVWFKIKGETENNTIMNPAVLAYVSDYNLLSTALRPHGEVATMGNTQIATIDHAMWFHKPVDINDWFLYDITSPQTFGGRGFVKGNIFNAQGELIASVAQEGLIRTKNK